ncbi:LysR family transcriptional regulator [Photobacterium profundum]|uniref:Transcriptional regulator n=1 Tax=Photobacterium profundum 3TCK TaxID=314280 RepID=Q1Z5X0_9GAMM|nr:LysR family transcriptional regulator [Photobacterium profundum]EAS44074.1 transcriptional regulator [Photobacterium profundum 3TCK]PSV61745.1 LysR family transcriptional regulator [Photobacterium profundum]
MNKEKNLDLNLLRVFDAVMKVGSVNGAAEQLEMSAPAVSNALNRLRDNYHDPLFSRQGRGIVPTAFAFGLHADIKEPLAYLLGQSIHREAFDPRTSHRSFHLSSHKDIDILLLPALEHYLRKYAPHVTLKMNIGHTDETARQTDLQMRKADLILATVPMSAAGYQNTCLFELPLVVVCRTDHPRVGEKLTMNQFFAESHILWKTQRHNTQTLDSLSKDILPERRIAYESDSVFMSMMLASKTDWLCVVSALHAELLQDFPNLKALPLPMEVKPLPIYMTWHQSIHSDQGHQWLKQALLSASRPLGASTDL